jgi:ABC-type transport system involved in multi-copper enzyme maturation permease subunit
LPSPILHRELITTLRAPRAAWTIFAVATLLSGLALALWPGEGMYSLGEQSSHALLNTVSLGGLVLALLIAPAFTSTSLTSEKENRSYDLLTQTLLRPWNIAWGKVASAQCFLLLVAVAALPALASTFFLGGTGLAQVSAIFGIIAAAGAATGLLGFAVSAWSRQSFTALVVTYSATLAWSVLPILPPLLLRTLVAGVPTLAWTVHASPIAAMLALVEPDLFAEMGAPVETRHALAIHFGACALLGAAAWFAGTLRILLPHWFERYQRDLSPASARRRLRFPYVLIDPRRRKRLIGGWTNPVLAKELRSRTFSQGPWLIRGMYATFTVSLVMVGLMVRGGATLHLDVLKLAMIAFQVLVVVLLTPALLAGAVTGEVEQRQFDLLRQTPLRPRTILLGKSFSAWLLVVLLLVAGAPMWWMLAYLENYQWAGTLISLAVVGATLFLASAASLACSCATRSTAAATAAAFALVCLVVFGSLVPLLMGPALSASWRHAILSWNPFAAGLQAVSVELLRGEPSLWKPFLRQTLGAGAALAIIAWLLLWRRMARQS